MKKLLVIAALALSCTTVLAEEEKKAESIEYVAIPFTNGETKNLWQFCKEGKVQQRGEQPSKDLPSGAERKATFAQFEMSREKNEGGNN